MVYKMSFKFFYEGVNRAFKKIDANNQLSIQGCLGLKSKPSIECRPETAKELCQSPIMASYLILISSCGGRKGGGGAPSIYRMIEMRRWIERIFTIKLS